jgi:uncharacterized surface protein with fasciclin (FAS1) repeats
MPLCTVRCLPELSTFDKLVTIESFRTFVRLIEGTEIETTLRSRSHITLFAPIDRSFSNLPQKFLSNLITAKNTTILLEILQYHLVRGTLAVSEVANNDFLTSEQGHELKITMTDLGLKINDANVVMPDIQTNAGMIHGIDELLIPGEIALVKYLLLRRRIATNTD